MNQNKNEGGNKKCPKCQELIQSNATKCKHCGADLRNWFLKHKIITGILVLIVLTIALSSLRDKSETSNVSQSPDQQKSEEQESSVSQEWQKVIVLTTKTDKQSDTFHLQGGKQKIIYTNIGGDMSVCYIYIVKEGTSLDKDGGFPEAMIDGNQSGETMARKSTGDYYLDIGTVNGSCSVELQELR